MARRKQSMKKVIQTPIIYRLKKHAKNSTVIWWSLELNFLDLPQSTTVGEIPTLLITLATPSPWWSMMSVVSCCEDASHQRKLWKYWLELKKKKLKCPIIVLFHNSRDRILMQCDVYHESVYLIPTFLTKLYIECENSKQNYMNNCFNIDFYYFR